MPETKMSAEQMTGYYRQVHHQVLECDIHDPLRAVIGPDASQLVNRFTDFAHRQGMKTAFKTLESKLGSLNGRPVLDLGCGRGRWTKEYAHRGAKVTGVDISPDVIALLAAEMPQHCFVSADIAALDFPSHSFHVVNSVTVLQHMPPWKQRIALHLLSRWMKPEGYLVLLENVLAFDVPHVFPHRAEEWIEMAEAAGLKCEACRGSNYELLFRIERAALRLLRGAQPSTVPSPPLLPVTPTRKLRIKSVAIDAIAAASFPVEWACQKLPLFSPTHNVMIFRKQAT
jgi:SAM-dependent methyltransferase